MDWIAHYRKAVAGAIGAGLLALAAAWFITSPHVITDAEWQAIIGAALGGAGGPALTKPNGPKPAKDQRGAADAAFVLLVLIFVGVVLLLFRVHLGG